MFLKHLPSLLNKTSTFSLGKNGEVIQTLSRTTEFLDFCKKKAESAASGQPLSQPLEILPKGAIKAVPVMPMPKAYQELTFKKLRWPPCACSAYDSIVEIYLQKHICVSKKRSLDSFRRAYLVTMGYDLLKKGVKGNESKERHWVYIAQLGRRDGGRIKLPFNRVLGEVLTVLDLRIKEGGDQDKYEHSIRFKDYAYGNWEVVVDWTTDQVTIHSPIDSIIMDIDEVDSFIDELTECIFGPSTMMYFNAW